VSSVVIPVKADSTYGIPLPVEAPAAIGRAFSNYSSSHFGHMVCSDATEQSDATQGYEKSESAAVGCCSQ